MAGAAAVNVVAHDPKGPLATRVTERLRAAGVTPTFAALGGSGAQVLVDDEGLPRAFQRLLWLQPGRSVYPNVILCVEDPKGSGRLLAEGFRDVVAPADVADAAEAILSGRPPVLLGQLRRVIEAQFLPELVTRLQKAAREKHRYLGELMGLVRAGSYLEKRIYELARLLTRQSKDEIHVLQGRVETYLDALDAQRKPRPTRMPRFPEIEVKRSVLGKHEPRYRHAREEVDQTMGWLRDADLLPAFGKEGAAEFLEAAAANRGKPLMALRALQRIVDREMQFRLREIERLEEHVDPLEAVDGEHLRPNGMVVVPPGIAIPEHVGALIRAVDQPPAELSATWCLDLRDLSLKTCAAVFAEITGALEEREDTTRRVPLYLVAGANPARERANQKRDEGT